MIAARLRRRDEVRRRNRGLREQSRDAAAEDGHVETRIVLAAVRKRVFLVSGAELGIAPDVLQNRRRSASIGVHLYVRPRIVRLTAVLRLDSDEARVSGRAPLPRSGTGMIRPAGGDDVVRPIPAESELRERTGQIRASVDERSERRHVLVAANRRTGVMANDAA